MATRFSSALLMANDTDAHFQGWAQFIEDTFVTTGGWVVTGDAGQTLPSALAHPTTTNSKKGYRVYRMADALQATYPVFMRVDFGSGQAGGGANPAIWTTIGTGSDGAGNITGVLWNGGGVTSGSTAAASFSSTIASNSYGSAATGRACFALGVQSAGGVGLYLVFGIERTKNSSGADTGDGLLLVYGTSSGGVNDNALARSRYLRYAGGVQPTEELGLSYITTNNNPSEVFTPGDIGLGIVIHFYGLAQQPGMNWMTCNSSDVSDEGFITTTLYGAMHTYQQLKSPLVPSKALVGNSGQDTNARVLMRYD